MSDIYCTTYCNQGHRLADGKPIGHACYVLPPKALELERSGDTDGAIAMIQSCKPLRTHRGIKE